MKLVKIAPLALALVSFAAMADDDQGHNGDEATNVACKALDAQGNVLEATSHSSVRGQGTLIVTGQGEIFAYRVELADSVASIRFEDKRSGDHVTVSEGDLDLNEVVSVTLTTDEDPQAALTLECKGS